LYLWQSTVTVLTGGMANVGLGRSAAAVLQILITFVIAGVSYRFVEMPFLRRKRAYQRVDPERVPAVRPSS
ncbi:MAG: hypothetical protein M3137_15315, partial [Actinomycetota bacterium]|nr:hypothetical protein [Actinomycetota bacterium]